MDDQTPTIQEWENLYNAVLKFKKLKPWRWMCDSDLFGVKNPETGETGYCCVLGAAGEFYGLSLFLGSEGLEGYLKIQSGELTQEDPEILYIQKCLMASLEDRMAIEDEDYHILKKLGLRFRGKKAWPLFRSYRPYYLPWFLNREEVRFLTLALEQAIQVSKRFKKNPDILKPPLMDQIMVRVRNNGGWIDEWMETPHEEKEVMIGFVEEDALNDMLELSHQGVWEVDYSPLPEPVQDDPAERPYFPYMIIWADHEQSLMMNNTLAEPKQWVAMFLDSFKEVIESRGSLPQKILLRREEIFNLLENIAYTLKIELKMVDDLDIIDDAQEYIENSLDDHALQIMDRLMEDETFQKMLGNRTLNEALKNGVISDIMKDKSIQDLIMEFAESELFSDEPEENLSPEDGDIPIIFMDDKTSRKNKRNNKFSKQTTLFPNDNYQGVLVGSNRKFLGENYWFLSNRHDLLMNTDFNVDKVKAELNKMINEEPDFLKPYLTLSKIFKREGNISKSNEFLEEAYQRALNLVLDKNGHWPGKLEDSWIPNWHIIDTFMTKAIWLWETGKKDDALNLFRKLLKTNPNDGSGARNYILAISMGCDYADFNKWINNHENHEAVLDWFEENYAQFPDEFTAWRNKADKKGFNGNSGEKEKNNKKLEELDPEADPEQIYQFKITLKDIRPPIWRRIQVPGTFSFSDLHLAIQRAMGWEDYHMHSFTINDPTLGERITIEDNEGEELISDWFKMETSVANYIYDYGDLWEHRVELEKILKREKNTEYPRCIEGKRACPPEDCGGAGGYYEILEILKNPEHEEYQETLEWIGEDFDSEHFNPEDVVFNDSDDY